MYNEQVWETVGASYGNVNSPNVTALRQAGDLAEDLLEKALTTGSGVVQPYDTGGASLRTQFLPKMLQQVSFEQEDAGMMKRIPKKKVPNNTLEWSDFLSYGVNGDGFVGETGATGNFDVSEADDNYQRQIQVIKYMGVQRKVSFVASVIQDQVANPMTQSEKGATLALIAAMNLGIYWADSTLVATQFNGFRQQIVDWVTRYPFDAAILYDAGGQPLSKDMLEDIAELNRLKFGRASLMMMTTAAYGDTQRQLYPAARYPEGSEGVFGVNKRKFKSTRGMIDLEDDIMLRRNQPLVADGVGLDGKPRISGQQTPGAVDFAATPWVTGAAASVGTGRFWLNKTLNNYPTEATLAAPEVPSGSYGGNNGNRLSAGTYYYAVAPVIFGREGMAWVLGEAGAGVVTGAATAITVSSGSPIVRLRLQTDASGTLCITGLGSTYPRSIVKFRIYRYGGPGTSGAPSSLSQFDLVGETGVPTGSNEKAAFYDNGYQIPGAEEAYFITENKNGAPGYFLAQLVPLMKRPLPNQALADLFALLAFVAPILWVPRHHVHIRNIGRANN